MAGLDNFKPGDRVRFTRYFHAATVDGASSALGVPPGTEGVVSRATDDGVAVRIAGWKIALWLSDGNSVEKI